jgi:type IV pilus assembly protein PilP
MNRKLLMSCGSIFFLMGIGVAVAQEPAPAEPTPVIESDVDVSRIEEILKGEEEVLQGGIFGYDPAGRRDPFRSLLEGFEESEEAGPAKARPPGLPGMLVEELKVEGIIEMPSGILAFVLGRDNVSYIIRPGTKLYNGEVAEIHPDRVVFRQYVNDPGRLKPYDEIVRELTD